MAWPCSPPPDTTVFGLGGGVGAGGGGGGSSFEVTTGAPPPPPPPPPVPPGTPTGPPSVTLPGSPMSLSPMAMAREILVSTTLAFSEATSLLTVTGAMTAISLTIAVCGSDLAAGFGSSGFGGPPPGIGHGAPSVPQP